MLLDDRVALRRDPARRDAVAQAQAEHEFLGVAVGVGQYLGVGDRQLAGGQDGGVAGGVFDVVEAAVAQVGVGAGAGPPPVAVAPVDLVVAALAAGPGPVGDLVPVEAGLLEAGGDDLVAVGVDVLVGCGQFAAADLAGHGGAVLDDERVGGDVVDVRGEDGVEGAADVVVSLGGRAVDHVQVDVVEAGGAGLAGGVDGAAGGVGAVEDAQHRGRGGLHPEGDAGEAGLQQPGEELRRDGLGVGFGGDLGAGGQAEGVADHVEHAGQAGGAEQGGGAAADEDGVGGAALGRGESELAAQGIQVGGGRGGGAELAGGVGVEVAVAATGGTERNVDVDAEHLRHVSWPHPAGHVWRRRGRRRRRYAHARRGTPGCGFRASRGRRRGGRRRRCAASPRRSR